MLRKDMRHRFEQGMQRANDRALPIHRNSQPVYHSLAGEVERCRTRWTLLYADCQSSNGRATEMARRTFLIRQDRGSSPYR
jgi:hypothetical protein